MNIHEFRRAIKTALAFVIVNWIALYLDWMNPYWAGLGVVLISLPSAGHSLRKGIDRIGGTLLACPVALLILSISAQDRWLFMALTALWVILTSYLFQADRQRAYGWFVAGFVCLIITSTGPDSSERLFTVAMYRTSETLLGIFVFTLINVFIWPNLQTGAVRKSCADIAANFGEVCLVGKQQPQTDMETDSLWELLKKQEQLQVQLEQNLLGESMENYKVNELRPLWELFQSQSQDLSRSMQKWQTSLRDTSHLTVDHILSNYSEVLTFIAKRMELTSKTMSSCRPLELASGPELTVDKSAFNALKMMDKAAITLLTEEIRKMDMQSKELARTAQHLMGSSERITPSGKPDIKKHSSRLSLVPQREHVLYALYAGASLVVGFLIWVFINPVGHSMWFAIPPTFAMMLIPYAQVKPSKLLLPILTVAVVGVFIYSFILPQLTSFAGLGGVLFLSVFSVHFFFSGIAQGVGNTVVTTFLPTSNNQSYDVMSAVDKSLVWVAVIVLLYQLSYLIGSPRPEKKVIALTRRFFSSTHVLLATSHSKPSLLRRWWIRYHVKQLRTLPDDILKWGSAIDRKLYPGNSPKDIQDLSLSLRLLEIRISQFVRGESADHLTSAHHDMEGLISTWRNLLDQKLRKWSRDPQSTSTEQDIHPLRKSLSELENHQKSVLDHEKEISQAVHALERLGACRGVTLATKNYGRVARNINWSLWKEERFS